MIGKREVLRRFRKTVSVGAEVTSGDVCIRLRQPSFLLVCYQYEGPFPSHIGPLGSADLR